MQTFDGKRCGEAEKAAGQERAAGQGVVEGQQAEAAAGSTPDSHHQLQDSCCNRSRDIPSQGSCPSKTDHSSGSSPLHHTDYLQAVPQPVCCCG